jgi:site-specific recombinase XerD
MIDNVKEVTLETAVWRYIQNLEEHGKSQITIHAYTWDLKHALTFFGTDCLLARITLTWVGHFLKSPELLKNKNGQPRSPRTISKTIRVFRMLLLWSQQQGWIEILPLPKSIFRG